MIYDIRPEYQTADSDSAREVEQLCADLEAALRDNEKLRDVLIEVRNANTLGAKMLARQTDLARQAEIDLASAKAENAELRQQLADALQASSKAQADSPSPELKQVIDFIETKILRDEVSQLRKQLADAHQKLGELAEAGTGYSQQTMNAMLKERTQLQTDLEAAQKGNVRLKKALGVYADPTNYFGSYTFAVFEDQPGELARATLEENK